MMPAKQANVDDPESVSKAGSRFRFEPEEVLRNSHQSFQHGRVL